MANRKTPVLVATRVTEAERALIDAAARIEGTTVTRLLRAMVLPQVRLCLLSQFADVPEAEGAGKGTLA